MQPIGYYLSPDDAVCTDHDVPETVVWDGNIQDPIAIFSDTESDSPTWCVQCGELIAHNLTDDGYAYLKAMAADPKVPSQHRADLFFAYSR